MPKVYLKTLRLKGFKSFVRNTTICFSPGISSIVGPNGCGKSNIVDAIKWVLGEQGYKSLRSKGAEDLIFNGTSQLKPASMAEVSLVFEKAEGHEEIMFTRRLFRQGEVVYLLNKRPCRLKDIREHLLNLGLGYKSYAIIDQGRVTELIEFSPIEKRKLLEEAAGIAKYLDKKEESLKKMAETKENLSRVEDILKEVQTQLQKLSRQAQKAKKYLEIKQELEQVEVNLLLSQYFTRKKQLEQKQQVLRSVLNQKAHLQNETNAINQKLKELNLELQRLETRIKSQNKESWEIKGKIKELKITLNHLNSQRDDWSKQIGHLKNRKERLKQEKEQLEKQIAKNQLEVSNINSSLIEVNNKLKDVQKELCQLDKKLNDRFPILRQKEQEKELLEKKGIKLDAELKHLKKQVQSIKEEMANVVKQKNEFQQQEKSVAQKRLENDKLLNKKKAILAEIQEKKQKIASQYELCLNKKRRWQKALICLEQALTRLNSQLKTARCWLKTHQPQKRPKAALASIWDIIEDASGVEIALEAILEFKAQKGWLVKDFNMAQKAINECNQPLIVLEEPSRPFEQLPIKATSLLTKIKVKEAFKSLAQRLLHDVFIADSLSASMLNEGVYWVTPLGELLTPEGILYRPKQTGVLKDYLKFQKMEQKLKPLIPSFERQISQTRRKCQQLNHQIKQQESFLKDVDKDIQQITKEINKLKEEDIKLKETLKFLQMQQAELEKRNLESQKRLQQIANRQSEIQAKLEGLNIKKQQLHQEIEALKTGIKKLKQAQSEKKDLEKQCNWRISELNTQKRFLERELQQQLARKTNIKQECEKLDVQIAELEHRLKNINPQEQDMVELINRLKNKLETIEESLFQDNQKFDKLTFHKKELEAKRHSVEKDLRKKQQLFQELNQEISRLSGEAELFKQRLTDEWNIIPENQPLTSQIDIEAYEQRRKTLKEQMEKIGAINLSAIEEYQEVQERYDFLKNQQSDLKKSLKDLQKAIQTIDKTSTEHLLKTLNQANQHFQKLLQYIFGKAEGEIYLEDPTNPLSSGIEFKVKLPGKRVKHHLLSMGERSLISLIFLFSLYFVKPGPFCILDEVDAGLDERNVERFCSLIHSLKGRTQLIIITHHRRVMEEADTLIGVTMEQKGVTHIVSLNFSEGEKYVQVV